jgi:hypothetical protein
MSRIRNTESYTGLPGSAEEMAELVVAVHLLELLQDAGRGPPQRTHRVHRDDRGEEQAGLFGDDLLAAGRRQLALEFQDLLLFNLGHLQLCGSHLFQFFCQESCS